MDRFGVLAGAIALISATSVQAAGPSPSSMPGSVLHENQNPVAKLHKTVGTAIDWNGVVTALPAGTSVIDTNTLKCAATSGCIIRIEAMTQVIANTGGLWSICTLVDGNQGEPGGCPVQGVVAPSNYVIGNLRQNLVVATGTHTVQVEVVMPDAGSIAAWEADYTVLKN
jgi:hypothetical protein